MIKISLLAGSVGMPIDDVVMSLKKAYPAKKVVIRERREPTVDRDTNRIQVKYDAATNLVYELQEG